MREEGQATALTGQLLDEDTVLSLVELCRACDAPVEWIREQVEEGVVEPRSGTGTEVEWRFSGNCLHRVRIVTRLRRDLGINLSGAVVVLELIEEIRRLRALHDWRATRRHAGLESREPA